MPRPVTAEFRAMAQAERTGDVLANLVTIATRDRYEREVLKSKPRGYWRLGETAGQTVAWDSSGNGRHGGYVGGVTLEQDTGMLDADPGVLFDGASASRVNVPHHVGLNVASSFSVACRFKRNGAGTPWDVLVAKEHWTAGTGWLVFLGDVGENLSLVLAKGGGPEVIGNQAVVDDAWHHAIATVSGGVGILELDGQQIASGALSGTFDAAVDLYIGTRHQNDGTGTSDGFPGLIDEVSLHVPALTQTQRAALYAALSLPTIPTIRVTDHRPALTSRGRLYQSAGFDFVKPSETSDRAAGRLRVSNVGQQLVEGVRTVTHRLVITGELVRAAAPDVVEASWPQFELDRATMTAMVVEGDVVARLARDRRYPSERVLPSTHPAAF